MKSGILSELGRICQNSNQARIQGTSTFKIIALFQLELESISVLGTTRKQLMQNNWPLIP